MRNTSRTKYFIITFVLVISILSWLLVLSDREGQSAMTYCIPSSDGNFLATDYLGSTGFASMALNWTLMVLAMMLPKLIAPVELLCQRSLKRFRLVVILTFIFSYLSVWLVAGFIFTFVLAGFNQWVGETTVLYIISATALFWQLTPVKQQFLNRGHYQPSIAAFGWRVLIDSCKFGLYHGLWCVGAGWALMLLPMVMPNVHDLMMALVAIIMFSEHMALPKAPMWNLRFSLNLISLIMAQTRIAIKHISKRKFIISQG